MERLVVDAGMLTLESELCTQRADKTSVSPCSDSLSNQTQNNLILRRLRRAQSRPVVTHRQGRTTQKMRTIEVPQVQY